MLTLLYHCTTLDIEIGINCWFDFKVFRERGLGLCPARAQEPQRPSLRRSILLQRVVENVGNVANCRKPSRDPNYQTFCAVIDASLMHNKMHLLHRPKFKSFARAMLIHLAKTLKGVENHIGKWHCSAGLRFYWFGFNCITSSNK